jgi:rhamnogalacturonyl hydrolase YesR
LWSAGKGVSTTAQIGMMCVSRYENTGKTGYREIIHTAADAYRKSMPGDGEEVWPVTIGQAISLQLAAWRSTAKQVYLDRARALGDFALERLFDQGPLPRATLHCDHYETITGADTLALALVELHLEILHITAVRYPPNTIDR